MKTRAVRIHGKHDLRLDEFELPDMGDDEILARMVADSTCTSSYKAALQGPEHKRVPANVAEHPTILGHEMSGEILEVGEKWKHRFKPGQKFSVQPALNYKGTLDAPGYSFEYFGGEAEICIIPSAVMEMDCLLPYDGPGYFLASLAEPVSCVVGTFRAMYHVPAGTHTHVMGTRPGGAMAILAGSGPMGLAAIDYAMHMDAKHRPRLIVVTGRTQEKLDRAARIYSPDEAEDLGLRLVYVNTRSAPDLVSELLSLNEGKGYDDVLVFAPVAALVEQADALLARDGCLNFFAGPADKEFTARLNFFNVHYAFTHLVATSGGNADDMKESLRLINDGVLNPASMITHIAGLNVAAETTLHLPELPGGKKLFYTELDMPLVAIDDFAEKGKTDPLFHQLAEITREHKGLWSPEAEAYLLEHAPHV